MDAVYNPAATISTMAWFGEIGSATDNVLNWAAFATQLIQVTAADTVGLLRMSRNADIDQALENAGLASGYKLALCAYLVAKGAKPFDFAIPMLLNATEINKTSSFSLHQKRFASLRNRPSIGRELGLEDVKKLTIPDEIFKDIKHSRGSAMKSKGNNSTEKVADAVFKWAVAKYNNLYADSSFCDRVGEILADKWPNLKPWSSLSSTPKPRNWSAIIANRFNNVRESDKARCTPAPATRARARHT